MVETVSLRLNLSQGMSEMALWEISLLKFATMSGKFILSCEHFEQTSSNMVHGYVTFLEYQRKHV